MPFGNDVYQIIIIIIMIIIIIREVSKKIFTFSRPWLLRGGGSGDMSRPTKLFYGLKRGKKGPKMVLKSTKKVN